MRRNWIAALLLTLALSWKALLPGAVGVARIAGESAGSSDFGLCQSAQPGGAGPATQGPQSPAQHHQTCLRCILLCESGAAFVFWAASLEAPLARARVSCLALVIPAPSKPRNGCSNLPRAPPSFS